MFDANAKNLKVRYCSLISMIVNSYNGFRVYKQLEHVFLDLHGARGCLPPNVKCGISPPSESI